MAIVTNNMTAAEITADLITLQSRMQFNTPEIYINGAIAFLNAFIPANSAQFTFNIISSTRLVVTQISTGIVWTVNGSGFSISNPFFTGTRTSETFSFPADNVTLASTPRLETGNFTFRVTDADIAGASVQVVVNNSVATRLTLTDFGIVGVLQGAFSADGNGTSTAFSLTNGTKALNISGFSVVNNSVGPVGTVGPLFIPAALAGNDTMTITGTAGIDLFGFTGNDNMIGGVGNDTLIGGTGLDSLTGNAGNDSLDGGAGNDAMTGGLGDDTLNGGLGNDNMNGGAGSDYYYVDSTLDVLTESVTLALGGGIDTVESSATRTLGLNFDHLVLTGTNHINGTGNALDNELTGNDGNNSLTGGLGADILNGGAGNDSLDGGVGVDSLTGGTGDDTYLVDIRATTTGVAPAPIIVTGVTLQDEITETNGTSNGIDTLKLRGTVAIPVATTISLTASLANIENLDASLTTTTKLNLTGNDAANKLTGNAANNSIAGGLGNDSLDGGLGNDTLNGGAGDDTYTINVLTDVILDSSGNDTLQAAFSLSLDNTPANAAQFNAFGSSIDNLKLLGATAINATGNGLGNILTGNAAANILDGKAGADAMNGGKGADTYIVDNADDTVTEDFTILQGGGIDLVKSSVSYSLLDTDGLGSNGGNVENLTLLSASSIDLTLNNINGTGNAFNNIIIGNAGNNILEGGAGVDVLNGGLGNDTYKVDLKLTGIAGTATAVASLQDTITEAIIADTSVDVLQLSGDINLLRASTITLAAGLENLNATGTGSTLLNLIGNDRNNVIIGNTANNLISGGKGNDSLTGGDGNDTLNGGLGSDILDGGFGDDTYILNITSTNVIIVNDLGGNDTVNLIGTFLGPKFEYFLDSGPSTLDNLDLSATGTTKIDAIGNILANKITGNAAANGLAGFAGNDTLIGAAGNDTLNGGADNDSLDGGLGNDTLIGGDGNDIYIVDAALDITTETNADSVTGGIDDEVRSSVTRTLDANIENLTLTGVLAINATGNGLRNTIVGNTAANILDGKADADAMNGVKGADTYIVDNTGDTVTEDFTNLLGGGIDLVKSSVSFTLGTNVDNLTLLTASTTDLALNNINGTGNAHNNIIIGNAGDNVIIGDAGIDSLTGNAGDDSLDGGAGNDVMTGGLGVDTLNGGTGNDNMNGGLGRDTYIVDSILDVLTEGATNALGGGIDTVQSSVTRTLGLNFDHLILTGSANIHGTGNALANELTGNDGNNSLIGGLGADTLNGGAGNDSLDGGVGVDSLTGDIGDDTYLVDIVPTFTLVAPIVVTGATLQDSIIETNGTSNGIDTLKLRGTVAIPVATAATTISLTANIENLDVSLTTTTKLNLTGNDAANILTGNAVANVIDAGLGNDTLNGGLGNDTMRGGDGNDTYIVNVVTDIITELGGEGVDTIQSLVTYSLVDTDAVGISGGNVENLELTGASAINATGNTLNNVLTGNAVANVINGLGGDDALNGGAGNDVLIGGIGADMLTGGLGADRFDFNLIAESAGASIDTIADFSRLQLDKIDLSTIDAKTGTPLINDAFTFIGNDVAFGNAAGQLRFDSATNSIFGDVDGDNAADFQIILTGVASLVVTDFIL